VRWQVGDARRRVLTSRKWSGKALADHRADRKAWLIETLGLEPPEPARYTWETGHPVRPRPHATRQAAAARRRRPRPLASRARRGQTPSPRTGRQTFGNQGGACVTVHQRSRPVERLLTVGQVAEMLGTTERFPRRLIEERRIKFVRIGRHVRIPESALREFIQAGLVEPIAGRTRRRAG
jgi:excisionase family DNA binding protein